MNDPMPPKDIVDIAKIYLARSPKGLYHRHPGEPYAICKDGQPWLVIGAITDSGASPDEAEGCVATLCMMLNQRSQP